MFERITVHTLHPAHRGSTTFYSSLTRDSEQCKQQLVSALWDHSTAMDKTHLDQSQSSRIDVFPPQVACDLLGKPYLMVGGSRGPAISFSESGGNVWAALSGDGSDIGIDVAGAEEFELAYPVHRVFHPEELQHALYLTGGVLEEAAALLWSVKEAVVKALGCAFHLVDPRQLHVSPSTDIDGVHTFQVSLSGKARIRFPKASGQALRVHSFPQQKMWFSIALLNRSMTGNG